MKSIKLLVLAVLTLAVFAVGSDIQVNVNSLNYVTVNNSSVPLPNPTWPVNYAFSIPCGSPPCDVDLYTVPANRKVVCPPTAIVSNQAGGGAINVTGELKI
jgi:hypothetical protein